MSPLFLSLVGKTVRSSGDHFPSAFGFGERVPFQNRSRSQVRRTSDGNLVRLAEMGLFVVLFCLALSKGLALQGSSVTLAWDPVPGASEAVYTVHYGTASHVYTHELP